MPAAPCWHSATAVFTMSRMFKSLLVPERWFHVVMWVVSVVFAAFLIGLGGRIIADLPRLESTLTVDRFADEAALARTRDDIRMLTARQGDLDAEQAQARLALTAVGNAYQSALSSYSNWVSTRTATTDPRQDPEVVSRTRGLETRKDSERQGQVGVVGLGEGLMDDREG